jgi:hypothetical protein
MEVSMDIDYTVQIWKEGDQDIAHGMRLDVIRAGPTPDGARAALQEAVHLCIGTTKEMGTLDQVLEECGYSEEYFRLLG